MSKQHNYNQPEQQKPAYESETQQMRKAEVDLVNAAAKVATKNPLVLKLLFGIILGYATVGKDILPITHHDYVERKELELHLQALEESDHKIEASISRLQLELSYFRGRISKNDKMVDWNKMTKDSSSTNFSELDSDIYEMQ